MPAKFHLDGDRDRIMHLRQLVGWTQFDLAKNSGVGRTRVSLYECGHVDLRQAEVAAIALSLERAAAALVSEIRSASSAAAPTKGRR
jgi:transcriptional regulator with XRE-family HTH domain